MIFPKQQIIRSDKFSLLLRRKEILRDFFRRVSETSMLRKERAGFTYVT